MKKRRLFLTLTSMVLFCHTIALSSPVQAEQRETVTTVQFAEEKSGGGEEPIVPPKDQVPGAGNTGLPATGSEAASKKYLPQTGEVLETFAQMVGIFLLGILLLLLLFRKQKEEVEEYGH